MYTSNSLPRDAPTQSIQPVDMLLRLLDHDRMTFLKNLVYRDERLESLDFIREDGLPVNKRTTGSAHHPNE